MSGLIDTCRKYNLPINKNAIGASGENIAKAILEYFPGFRVVFLGEKFPVVDFYVEIEEYDCSYPFLVQVKATTSDLTAKKKLRVSVPKQKYESLHRKPIPTYVGGVQLDKVALYIEATHADKKRLTSISPSCVLSLENQDKCAENIIRIKNDVKAYWDSLNAFEKKKNYKSAL